MLVLRTEATYVASLTSQAWQERSLEQQATIKAFAPPAAFFNPSIPFPVFNLAEIAHRGSILMKAINYI